MSVAESPAWAAFRRAAWEREQGECWVCETPITLEEMQLDGGWDGDLLFPKHRTCRRKVGTPRTPNPNGQLRLFEAARLYGLSPETLREWAFTRTLPLYRSGRYGHFWVKVSDVEKIVMRLAVTVHADA